MNIEYLKTFLTLVENGSFSKTAKEHIIAQSTVSSRIKELEKEIGQRLFTRTRNYADLTLAGQALLEYAQKIVWLESKALDRVHLIGTFSEKLMIGTVYAFYKCQMTQNISHFLNRHEDISVRVEFGHSRQIISAIHKGKIDIGYSHHMFNHVGFYCELLNSDRIILATGRQNRKYINGITMEEIRSLPIYNSNFLYTDTHNQILTMHKIFQLDIDIAEYVVPYLLTGECYTFLSPKLIQRELEDGLILEIPILDGTIPTLKNYVIYKKESHKSAIIQQWLQEFSPT